MAEIVKIGSESVTSTTTTGNQTEPDIVGLTGGGYVVTWQDYNPSLLGLGGTEISLRVYDANGNPVGNEITANPPSIVGGQIASQSEPAITALSNGGFAITWTDPALLGLTGNNVITQIYDANGVPVGSNFSANGGLLGILVGDQENGSVAALSNSNYVVVWNNTPLLGETNLQAQIISSGGTKIGDQFAVNTITNGLQTNSVVTGLSGGGFVVAWEDSSNGLGENSGSAIAAQIFDSSGNKVGSEFRVNTTTAGSQTQPEISALTNGNFVVSWTDPANSGDLKAQIYTAAGVKVGVEFTLGSVTTGVQGDVSIAATAGGGFVAAWEDSSGTLGDTSGTSIVVQAFDASGNAIGSETRINTATAGNQLNPSITVLADGTLAVSWQTPGVGGNTQIVTQHLAIDSAPDIVTLNGSTIPENSANGTVVGTVTAHDADGGTITYTLTNNAGGAFAIDPNTGVITVADGSQLDYETATSEQITVRATDQYGLFTDQNFTISVSNVDEMPTLTGTPGDDVITAPSNDTTTIYGGDGNDTLNGAGGNDTLYGGNGDDILNGMDGDDTLYGEAGNDTLSGGNGSDTLYGGDGTEVLNGNDGDDILNGGAGDDQLYGGAGSDTLNGNDGNDLLDGGTGADVMTGGAGDDTYIVDNAGDVVNEAPGEGNDTIQTSIDYTLTNNQSIETLIGTNNVGQTLTGNDSDNIISGAAGNDTLNGAGGNDTLNGNDGNDTLNGGDGDDQLHGGAGNDTLNGNDGNDLLDGGTGADVMTGGAGDDTYIVDNAGDVVNEAPGQGNDTIQTSIDYTLANNQSIETLIGTNNAGQTLTGNDSDNTISGAAGDDTLNGAGGNDTLNGNDGNDTLNGGDGNDQLYGGAGTDTLNGNAGNDLLDGGTGADVMTGGTGDDTYVVDNASDVVNENPGEGTDTIQTSIDYTLTDGDSIENLKGTNNAGMVLVGNSLDNQIDGAAGNDTISGLAGDDTLNGNDGNDTLYGGDGNDVLNGGAGIDTMVGGAGNDTYYVDSASDVVQEAAGGGTDTVVTSINYTLGSGSEIEQLTANSDAGLILTGNELNNRITGGGGADTISGLDGDDQLFGGAGNDTIDGGNGNDTIDGGTGADTMTGGAGNDTYYVDDAGDTIVEGAGGGTDVVRTSVSYTLGAGVQVEQMIATVNTGVTLTGNEFDNTISGAAGDDTLYGMAGNDTLNGNAGGDTLYGGDGNDNLNGGDGIDTLEGGAGNDRLNGGTGADVMRGGAGDDVYTIDNAGDTIVEALGEGNDIAQTSVNYTLAEGVSVERLAATSDAGLILTGNSFDNRIDGRAGADTISGMDGNDSVFAGAGNDIVYGGNGNDVLRGEDGNDTIDGGTGNDTLDGGAGIDTLTGGVGDDTYFVDNAGDTIVELNGQGTDTVQASVSYTLAEGVYVERLMASVDTGITLTGNSLGNTIYGAAGDDTLRGLAGNDTLYGGAGTDTLEGGDGNDRLEGGAGADILRGGIGDDTYVVDNAGDTIEEGVNQGNDTVLANVSYTLAEGIYVETLRANVNTGVSLTGNSFDNRIEGAAGADTISGMAGMDVLSGKAGDDVVYGGDGNDTVNGDEGNDQLYGGSGDDTVYGGIGNDLLLGNDGNDKLDGGAGNDTLQGGLGDDQYTVEGQNDTIIELAGQGYDTVLAYGNYTLSDAMSIEQLSARSNADLTLVGNLLDNRIDGLGGDDTLMGMDGNDTIYGGLGTDHIEGGNGADTIRGDDGNDTLFGNDGDDSLAGGNGTDILYGGAGNDTLDGNAGNDTMVGGLGNDTYRVDSLNDIVQEASGEGNDTVVTSISYKLTDTMSIETLTASVDTGLTLTGNNFDNRINGRGGADTIYGGGGNDSIYGGAGNDVIHGGTGLDQLRGEAGADLFVFDTLQDSGATQATADKIIDFSSAQGDKIDLSAIDAITGGGNDAFTFVNSFSHVAGQLTTTAIANGFLVQADVNGDAVADFSIVVSTSTPLTASDFIL
ncbi:cadherin domain-containing protein [Flavisphingomonas formosensis]|uniref:cadherin domain-containing protein n=1 Tax=Flavisphingomonas formosensis TaxID=861534 RepID=UPI0022B76BBA|nr:cadherin domain-containing protein [Sphingomonas formosensis]